MLVHALEEAPLIIVLNDWVTGPDVFLPETRPRYASRLIRAATALIRCDLVQIYVRNIDHVGAVSYLPEPDALEVVGEPSNWWWVDGQRVEFVLAPTSKIDALTPATDGDWGGYANSERFPPEDEGQD
jgi:hypothetical protein